MGTHQLISYIAPAAPATRRPATGHESFLRPEIGFTPKWYHDAIGVDFGRRWHDDPAYRKEALVAMRGELAKRFAGTGVGGTDRPLDLLTGAYGVCCVAAIYGVLVRCAQDRWPVCEKRYLSVDQVERLEPPDLDANDFFQNLLAQVDRIAEQQGRVEGYINWQGVLNNAWRLRGEALLTDLLDAPQRCWRLFDCVSTTMIEAARRLHERQRRSGVEIGFITVSNCLVNMVSPQQYRELLLPFDRRIAEAFGCIGIHNCAWNADPYLDDYAGVPHVGYIDMGLDSDLVRARQMFGRARRALMY
ncbi:MAG: uroporphyrinogen decarboxylase family protein, partial [Planctomycetota bacterium]